VDVVSNHFGWVHFLKLLISYNETHLPTIDDEGEIGVRKKQYILHIWKRKRCKSRGLVSRIEKFLYEEFVCNVSVTQCCSKNCY
jgi:hypothetical protein